MFKKGKAAVETPTEPVQVTSVNGNITRVSGRGIVAEVQHDRVMHKHQLIAAVPVPGEQEEAIRRSALDGAMKRYRESAAALVAGLIADWAELEETHKEWRSAAAGKRATADQKRAEAATLRGKMGRTHDVVTLRSDAAKLEDAARYDDQGADDVAQQMNEIRDRIGATLDASNSSLMDTATAHDDAATGRAMAKLSAVLVEVMPVLVAAHALKAAKTDMTGSARSDFLDGIAPRQTLTSEPEPTPIAPPTRHPVAAQHPTAVRVANPAGGIMTPDQYSDPKAGAQTVNSRGEPVPYRFVPPGEMRG